MARMRRWGSAAGRTAHSIIANRSGRSGSTAAIGADIRGFSSERLLKRRQIRNAGPGHCGELDIVADNGLWAWLSKAVTAENWLGGDRPAHFKMQIAAAGL